MLLAYTAVVVVVDAAYTVGIEEVVFSLKNPLSLRESCLSY
jgi:hypothetical protein